MKEDDFSHENEINKLINSAFAGGGIDFFSLRNKYEKRLVDLGITSNQVQDNLGIEYRTLEGLLDGNLKRFDLLSLIKLGHFLEIPEKEIVDLYTKFVAEKHKEDIEQAKKKTFILNNFDLPVLKSIGIIDSIKDFNHIEQRLTDVFDLVSIMDYDSEDIGAVYSSTKVKPKNEKSRLYFINKSRLIFRLINNPNRYDKQALIDYFPKIRWHSTDIENGLLNVIRSLYQLGVTVIFQPKIPNLQLRGATFEVRNKPCIVLTDYRNSYPTMWFAFLHELFHVLFDWDEILTKRFHLSDEENDLFVVRQKEEEANDFAREYLFPSSKLELIRKRIQQKVIVKEYALENHVHPSIVYANFAFKNSTNEENYWMQFDKLIRPSMEGLTRKLFSEQLSHKSPASFIADHYKNYIFNTEEL